MGFCKLQTKKCDEISTTRVRHVDYLHSSSIYPQKSENKTEKGRKCSGCSGRGAVVITTAQLHSTMPKLRFCTGSKPARDNL